MRTKSVKCIKINHQVADIKIEPHIDISVKVLKQLICVALDNYAKDYFVSADVIHQEAQKRHGAYYRTPGYYLKIFRIREDLTQVKLASLLEIKQHHLSEMEHNKRSIGKKLAKQIAEILNIDYRKLL